MLVAQSLGKRPIIVPNLSPSHEHVKRFLSKCTVLKVDLLQDRQMYYLQALMCALFSPEISQSGAVKGLIDDLSDEQTQI